MQKFGFVLLLFLPVLESYNRYLALFLLFCGSAIIYFQAFGKKKVFLDPINILFFFFIFWGIFTTFFSWSVGRSLTELLRYFAYFLIFTAIRQDETVKKSAIKFFVLAVTLNSILLTFLFLIYSVFKLEEPATLGMNLFYPVFGHNRISVLLILLIPLLMGLRFLAKVNKYKKILNVSMIISGLLLLVSFGRGAWLSLVLGVFSSFLLFVQYRKFYLKTVFFCSAIFIFLTAGIYLFSNYFTDQKAGVRAYLGLYKPAKSEKRAEYYKQGFKAFVKSPVIGTGLDTFRFASKKFQDNPYNWSWYLHNHFIQIFTDTGISGGILFISLSVLLILRAIKNAQISRNITIEKIIILSLFPSVFHSVIDYDWQFVSILMFIFIGFAISVPLKENSLKMNPKVPLFVFASLFFTWAVFIRDSDKVLAKHKDNVKILYRTHLLDAGYNEIGRKVAFYYSLRKDYNYVHCWRRYTIKLAPLESDDLIQSDFWLYLEEAEDLIGQNQNEKAREILNESERRFPYIYKKHGKSLPAKEDLSEYIKTIKNIFSGSPIRSREFKEILNSGSFY